MATADEFLLKITMDVAGLKEGQKATEDALKKLSDAAEANAKKVIGAEKGKAFAIDDTANAAEDSGKKQEDGAKKADQAYGKWLGTILKVGLALWGLNALKKFAASVNSADAETSRLARQVGMATPELQQFQEAAKYAGGSAEDAAAGIAQLSQDFQGLKYGAVPSWMKGIDVSKAFSEMNLDPEFMNQATSMTDRMLMLHKGLSQFSMPEAITKGTAFGLPEGLVRLLADPNFDKYMKMANLNKLSTGQGNQAEAMDRAWSRVLDTLTNLMRLIKNALGPAFEQLAGDLVTFLNNKDNVKAIVDTFETLGGWVKNAFSADNLKAFQTGISAVLHDIRDIIKGLHDVGESLGLIDKSKEYYQQAPSLSNGYNDSGGKRTATKATMDVVNGSLFAIFNSIRNMNHAAGEGIAGMFSGSAMVAGLPSTPQRSASAAIGGNGGNMTVYIGNMQLSPAGSAAVAGAISSATGLTNPSSTQSSH